MQTYKTIYEHAVILHPGRDFEDQLPVPAGKDVLESRDDARYLSTMARRIFRAGLKHSMVDAKWPAFETVFKGFEPARVRLLSDDDLDRMMRDRRIIRHWRKLNAVRGNAQVMFEQARQGKSFGRYLADWPATDIVALWQDLKSRFTQMGGQSAPYFLRMADKDTFILTKDVICALNRWGAFQGMPTTIKAKQKVQAVFNRWAEESGRPLCQLSRILALSVDE